MKYTALRLACLKDKLNRSGGLTVHTSLLENVDEIK